MLSKEVKVGLLALTAGVILYIGFNYLKGIELLSSTNRFWAVYNSIDGLQISNPILINGHPVGRVGQITILQEDNNKILVALDIEEHISIGSGASAKLADDGLLGGKIIELETGDISQLLSNGDTLKAEKAAGLMDEIGAQATPVLGNVDEAIITFNKLMKEYQGMGESIKNSMANLEKATGTLNTMLTSNQQKIGTVLTNLEQTTATLNSDLKKLEPILSNVDNLTDSLQQAPIKQLVTDAQGALSEMKTTLEIINSDQGTIGMLMNNDSLYRNMNHAMADLDSLFIDLKEHPKRYVHFSLFGKKIKTKN